MESPTDSNTRIEVHFSDVQRSLRTTPVTTSGWDSNSEAEVFGTIDTSNEPWLNVYERYVVRLGRVSRPV